MKCSEKNKNENTFYIVCCVKQWLNQSEAKLNIFFYKTKSINLAKRALFFSFLVWG